MSWRERRFLEVKDLCDPAGPFEGLVKKDLCYKLLDQRKILSVRVGGRSRAEIGAQAPQVPDRLCGAWNGGQCPLNLRGDLLNQAYLVGGLGARRGPRRGGAADRSRIRRVAR